MCALFFCDLDSINAPALSYLFVCWWDYTPHDII